MQFSAVKTWILFIFSLQASLPTPNILHGTHWYSVWLLCQRLSAVNGTDISLLVSIFQRQMGIECWSAERNCLPRNSNCLTHGSLDVQPGECVWKGILLRRLKPQKRSNSGCTKLILRLVSCSLSIKCGRGPGEAASPPLPCSSAHTRSPLWN